MHTLCFYVHLLTNNQHSLTKNIILNDFLRQIFSKNLKTT